MSVVVPTRGRPDLLARCLAALLAQDLAPDAYEVIVADDGPDDDTRRLVEGWARHAAGTGHTIGYVAVRGAHGPAAARNAGWRAARGLLIAFTDDDCIPAATWLSAGRRACVDGIAGASGRIVVPTPSVATDYERNVAYLEASHFVTANCFYRRDMLAAVGGFDARYTVAWREDTDLLFALRERGARLVDAPDAVVVHPVRPARWGVSVSQQRKSMFNALLYRKYPGRYRHCIQPTPPWHYYATTGALIVAVAASIAAYLMLPPENGGRRSLRPLVAGGHKATGGRSLRSMTAPRAAVSLARARAPGHSRRTLTALTAYGVWALLTARFCAQRLHGTSHAPYHVAEMIASSALIPPLAIYWRLRGALRFRVFFL